MDRQHADALASIAANQEQARAVAESIRRTGRLLLLGMGASHWVNRTAEVLYRRAGVDAVALTLAEALASPLPASRRTAVVTSQSGGSAEVALYLGQDSRDEERFGLTLDPASAMARRIPCLVGHGGIEIAFAATRSLLVCHALHYAILAALGQEEPAALEALRRPPDPDISAALATVAGASTLILTAKAELVGMAEAGALCLMELGRQPALGLEGAQLRHGPMEALGPGVGIVALRGPGPTGALLASLVAGCVEAGSPSIVFDLSGEAPLAGTTTIALPASDGFTAVFNLTPPLQKLLIARAATLVDRVGEPVRSTKVTTVL
jgi:fructoselysine-6-P-deglycase FrlB-like protein